MTRVPGRQGGQGDEAANQGGAGKGPETVGWPRVRGTVATHPIGVLVVVLRGDDDDRAVRAMGDPGTDRSHQQVGEPARAARPDHDHVSVPGCRRSSSVGVPLGPSGINGRVESKGLKAHEDGAIRLFPSGPRPAKLEP